MTELSNQFNCPDCGKPQYTEKGYEPHDHSNDCPTCGDSKADGHWHTGMKLTLDPSDIEFYKKVNEMGKLQGQMDNIDATREVDLTNKADLLDHLGSDNGHGFAPYAGWCHTYDGEGLRTTSKCNQEMDHEMDLTQLQSVHQELHEKYSEDYPHENTGDWRSGTHRHLE